MSDHECIVHCSPEAPGEVITHTAATNLGNSILLCSMLTTLETPFRPLARPNFQLSPRQPQPAAESNKVLINRHTYAYGIWEGIGVCIGVPAKRGNSEHNGHSPKSNRVTGCNLRRPYMMCGN